MDNIDVTDLTDEELKAMLLKYGFQPGPIVRSTRGLYEKKLIKLLQGGDEEKQEEMPNSDSASSWSTPVRGSPKKPPTIVDRSPPRVEPPQRESASYLPAKSSKVRTENDRMEGEEYYRYVPDAENAPSYEDEGEPRTTEIRQRFSGTGSSPLYAKPVDLPGHSLRPWLSKPLDSSQRDDDSSTSPYVSYRQTAASSSGSGFSKSSSQPAKKIVVEQRLDGGLPWWVKLLMAFIVGVFLFMLARRAWMEMSDVGRSPDKLE